MTIEPGKVYGLKGKQVTDLAGRIEANASDIAGLETAVAGKQDALSATQLSAVNSGIDSTKVAQIATNATDIDAIEGKIPTQATAQNQLADKDFVNSSVATNTANYISDDGEPFTSLQALEAYSGSLSNNDYAFVVGTDSAGNTTYTRYKYVANEEEWAEEYVLNNSSFTASQWAAISSGITSADVSKLGGLADIKSLGANLSLSSTGELSATDTTYSNATQSVSGLMSPTDKTKLDGIETGAEVNTIESVSVNGTSVSPDANKNVDLTIGGGEQVFVLQAENYTMTVEEFETLKTLTRSSTISERRPVFVQYGAALGILANPFATPIDWTATNVYCGAVMPLKWSYTSNSVAGSEVWLQSALVSINTTTRTVNFSWNGTSKLALEGQTLADTSNGDAWVKKSAIQSAFNTTNGNIGTLTSLTTTDKTSVVAAINEVSGNIPIITMTDTDPGEGSTLAANSFIAVYDGSN